MNATRRSLLGVRRGEATMRPHRTLIRGADILTMNPVVGERLATDLLLDGGRIVAMGPSLAADDAEVVEARGMIVMPGMIDGHRHLWESMSGGVIAKISPTLKTYHEWKLRTMVCYRPEDAWLAQYAGAIQAIDSGVTSILDYCHIFHTPELAEAAAQGIVASGIGGTFCYQVSHSPTYGPGQTVDYALAMAQRNGLSDEAHWRTVERLRNGVFSGSTGSLRFGLAGSAGSSPRMSDLTAEFERLRRYEPHIIAQHHQKRTPKPPEFFSAFAQLGTAGLLGPDFHVSHGNGMTDEELRIMADHEVMLCATTTGEQTYQYPSVHGLARDLGVAVGIGTDGPQAFISDYFVHARNAWYNLLRTEQGRTDARRYSATDVLDFSTRMGARAIREGDETGMIAVGRRADVLLLGVDRLGFPSRGTLAERVINYAQQTDLDSVWVAGVARKRHGRMIGVDLSRLKMRMAETCGRINAQAATINFVGMTGVSLHS